MVGVALYGGTELLDTHMDELVGILRLLALLKSLDVQQYGDINGSAPANPFLLRSSLLNTNVPIHMSFEAREHNPFNWPWLYSSGQLAPLGVDKFKMKEVQREVVHQQVSTLAAPLSISCFRQVHMTQHRMRI